MIEIEIEEKTYSVANIHDLTLANRTKLYSFFNDAELRTDIRAVNILHLLTGVDVSILQRVNNIFDIDFKKFLEEPLPKYTEEQLIVNGYKPIQFKKLTVLQFITLQHLMTNMDESSVIMILNILYFDGEDIDVLPDISLMTGGVAQFIIERFSNDMVNFYKTYEGLFHPLEETSDMDEDDPEESEYIEESENEDVEQPHLDKTSDYGIMEFVYTLANDDFKNINGIKQSNLFEVFEYLSWRKIKNDREVAAMKRK